MHVVAVILICLAAAAAPAPGACQTAWIYREQYGFPIWDLDRLKAEGGPTGAAGSTMQGY